MIDFDPSLKNCVRNSGASSSAHSGSGSQDSRSKRFAGFSVAPGPGAIQFFAVIEKPTIKYRSVNGILIYFTAAQKNKTPIKLDEPLEEHALHIIPVRDSALRTFSSSPSRQHQSCGEIKAREEAQRNPGKSPCKKRTNPWKGCRLLFNLSSSFASSAPFAIKSLKLWCGCSGCECGTAGSSGDHVPPCGMMTELPPDTTVMALPELLVRVPPALSVHGAECSGMTRSHGTRAQCTAPSQSRPWTPRWRCLTPPHLHSHSSSSICPPPEIVVLPLVCNGVATTIESASASY